MDKGLVARATVTVKASPTKVWAALTTPAVIKKYFFGADIVTTWAVGSPILYRGQWQGKPYEDKGIVLEFEPGKRLVTTHWSPLAGLPDLGPGTDQADVAPLARGLEELLEHRVVVYVAVGGDEAELRREADALLKA